MDRFKIISRQTAWQLLGKAVTSLTSFIALALISKSFGEEGVGVFTLALAYLAFFYLLVDFGFNAHLMGALLERGSGIQLSQLLGLRFIWGVVLAVIAGLVAYFVPVNSSLFQPAVLWGALSIWGFGIFMTTNALFQAKLKYQHSTAAYLISSLVMLGSLSVLIHNHASLPKLLMSVTLEWSLAAFIGFLLARGVLDLQLRINLPFIKRTFLEAWPLSITLLLNLVYFRVDSFILSASRSISEVGIYNLSYTIFQAVLVLPSFIMNSFYPMMIKDLSSKNFAHSLKKMNVVLLGLSIPTTLALFFFSPFLTGLLSWHKGFMGSTSSLEILSLSFPAFFCSALFSLTLIALKKYQQALLIYGLGLLVNLILNLSFIPHYSYIAASVITDVSEYFILTLQILFLRRIYGAFY